MSITPREAEYDAYMDELYEEHRKEAIMEFTGERLQSYYFDHRLLAKPAVKALSVAKELIDMNKTAAFIFAFIAIEVGMKTMLLKPIVYGLVHAESIAELITDLALSHAGMDRYKKLIFKIMLDHGGVELENYKRPETNQTLWEEIKTLQKIRNTIIHRGETAFDEETSSALKVASEIIEIIFPTVLKNIGFHIHDGYEICSGPECKCGKLKKIEEMLSKLDGKDRYPPKP